MFSTTPTMGTFTFSNILRPLRASISAMSCGVVTMMAPVTGTFCASVSWMSPVPGGKVDDQVVDVAPVGVAQELLERLRDHRPAPDHRRVGVDQEADRHRLHTVGLERLERLAVLGFGPAGNAEHGRLRGTVNVRVENTDAGAFGRERERQVHRRGRLADAAFAARDRDYVLDAGNELHAALDGVRRDLVADAHRHLAHAGKRRELLLDKLAQDLVLAARGIGEHQVDRDVAAVDLHLAHRFAGDEIAAGVGIVQCTQAGLNVGLGDCHLGIVRSWFETEPEFSEKPQRSVLSVRVLC